MGVGFKVGGSAVFKSFVTVQANPSAVVTLTLGSLVYNAQADSNGVASFTVKKKGTYTVTSNNTASYQAENNTSTINVNKSNRSFTGQMVKLNIPAALSSGNYSSNVLSLYWTRPSSNWTGCDLRWHGTTYPTTRTAGTSLAKGAGGNLVLTSASTVNGYNHTGLTANSTYYYSIFSYITINGTDYWATAYRSTSGKAINYVGTVVTITSTRTWAVPTGWRTAKVFVVGGGGGGAIGSGGGGAGGKTATSGNFNVTPGGTYVATIGGGGSANGGSGGTTSFGSVVSAAGGAGGNGLHGGSGGSGGGASGIYKGNSYDCDGSAGASDGGNASSNGYVSGNSWHYYNGGTGQGTTTKAWGSSSGTLYSGGGGGGSRNRNYNGGSGGSGGGGAGSSSYTVAGTNGTANTGGGGGGGAYDSSSEAKSNGGSGGSGIILVQCVA